ncbi:DUF1294 domain-containing protein [Methanofollis aquaemaris]|uniref:DUF1294 domain-containing protein n=1 Tax=Methanofollis aquaemaris TaxID=126734 RepID=A0A8A3S8Q7_9EURY|nr:DUF1294 domain-containing protein [Methanofollis aquaemaris]QSZ68060.1 DUF1294 domain-containing protein [Methanofollis aquaemaris]
MEGTVPLLALYLLLNLGAASVFWNDKRKARAGRWRTSENLLLVVAFLGPFGAWWAMRRFRHKTQKPKFKLVPAFLFVHLAAAVGLLYLVLSGI